MFAKPKMSPTPSVPSAKSGGLGLAGLREILDKTLVFAKKPFVAPIAAFSAFAMILVVFLNLSSDPDAASPSVRINLAKQKSAAAAPTSGDNSAGMQGFTLDSLGMFQDASADGFNLSSDGTADPATGTAMITLPGSADDAALPKASQKVAASPLPQAPISGLVQTSDIGPLPVIAPGGQTPASAYARPFKGDGRPMVALVVGGLGINPVTTREAIESLPPQITLSFVPYTTGLQGWIDLARASGHEVMIEIPMQPSNYPDNDPGPQTLMANSRTEDVISHLNWALSRATGYFAVSNYQGGAFFKDKAGLSTVLDNLKSRGIAFIDDGQARGSKGAWGRASADRIVDNQINATAIMSQLSGLEVSAKSHGTALGTGFAYPVTLAVALKWTQGLDAKGLQLAPASALAH